MEKKRYKKPEVNQTKLDSSINILLVSCLPEDQPCEGPVTELPQEYLNPFKWLK
jgi:hypothetical protein